MLILQAFEYVSTCDVPGSLFSMGEGTRIHHLIGDKANSPGSKQMLYRIYSSSGSFW